MVSVSSPPVRSWNHPRRLFPWAFALFLIVSYALPGLYIYSVQSTILYEGATVPIPANIALKQAKAVNLVPWDQPVSELPGPQGFVRPDFAAPAPRGTIVFFHGNGEAAYEWEGDDVAPYTQRGFRVFLYEYPGYGSRPGVPSEKAIVPDARAVIRYLDKAGFGPIYVWGESLGSGVAAAVCGDPTLPIHGLTLVTPWDTLPNVAASYYPYYPVRLFVNDKYDSVANLEHFQHPICLIRGDRDDTIPPPLSVNLFAHLPNPKKEILKAGFGHGDWPDDPHLPYWDEAINFIAPKIVSH